MSWDVYVYDLPLTRPYSWAKGNQTRRQGLLVARRQGELSGWGEVAFPPHETHDLDAAALTILLHAEGWSPSHDDTLHPRLRAGLAGAWFDLEARKDRDPLARILAEHAGLDAVASRVAVNGLLAAGPADVIAVRARELVDRGFQTLKLKSNGDQRTDVAALAAIRDAIGPNVKLRLDANESWAPAAARGHLEAVAPFQLEYVEQPVAATFTKELARLVSTSPVPIALDESLRSWDAIHPYLQGGGAPILIVKPQRVGGVDRAAMILARAQDHHLRAVVTNSLETAVGRSHALHVAALLHDGGPACGLATAGYLADDVASRPDDRPVLSLPERAGLGIDPNVGGLRHVVP
jgi:o-succinylbenzoate synthase